MATTDDFDVAHTKTTARPFDMSNPLAALRDGTVTRLRDIADGGKHELLGTLDGLVQAAHDLADKLQGSAVGPVADYARRAADTIEHWQHSIAETPVEELLDDGRELIRQSPLLALGVSVAAGFVAARLIKVAGR